MPIVNLSATTELEAVNAMLSAIGESPVETVDTAHADVERAVNLLRDKTRTLQNRKWKFNTEFGLALTAASTAQAWTDPDDTAKTLSVFTPPAYLGAWNLSRISEQASFDVTIRPSKVYQVASAYVLVFYDRKFNRDGFEASTLRNGKLYIDATWRFDFANLPDVARRYVTTSAARQFIAEALGDDNARLRNAAAEELSAWRDLREEEGEDDVFSLLDSPDTSGILGGRLRDRGYGLDERSNP